MVKVAPSILTADFGAMAETVKMLDAAGADWIHCDVMDGVFVPPLTFGPPMVKALRKATQKPLDVHLMINTPANQIEAFAESGADIITVHPESASGVHLHRLLSKIKSCGKKAGVALNPATGLEVLDYVYDMLDLVLVMSVNPGYGGQSFIPAMLKKLESAAQRIARLNLKVELEVDGGVTVKNAGDIASAGATVLVAGTAVVEAADPAGAMRLIKGA